MILTMLNDADDFVRLMKKYVDDHLVSTPHLQELLTWAYQKQKDLTELPYKPASIRAFYISIYRDPAESLTLALSRDFSRNLGFGPQADSQREAAIMRARELARKLGLEFDPRIDVDPELQKELEIMRSKLPEIRLDNWSYIQHWYQTTGRDWIDKLNDLKDRYQYLVRHWAFSEEIMVLLRQYLSGNQILVSYLDSGAVSQNVRNDIEEMLLLPIAEIEKRKREKVE